MMLSRNYERLVREVNECIPFWTNHLDTLSSYLENIHDYRKQFESTTSGNILKYLCELEQLINLNSLLTISLLDLSIICKNIVINQSRWELIFFIRQGYLIIYEINKTLDKYRKFLQNFIEVYYQEYIIVFKEINEDLKSFKKNHDFNTNISLIRNKIAGHVDQDFTLFYNITKQLDGEKMGITISDFLYIIGKLQHLSNELVLRIKISPERNY